MKADIKGFDNLSKIIDKLDNPKLVNNAIRNVGDETLMRAKVKAPRKTGKFSREINSKKRYNNKYLSYAVVPTTRRAGMIYGVSEHGTNPRFRT